MKSKIIDFSNLKGDFIGGLVAGVVAYHSPLHWCAIRNGATAGLYGAIMVGIFAAIFGGTPTQASGPTGPMTVVSAALVAASIQLTGSLETALGIILLTSSRWSFANYFWTDKHRRICEVFSLPRSFWFYEWSRSNHYTSSIIPFVGLNSAKSTFAILEGLPDFSEFNIHAVAFRHFDSVNLLFNPPLTKDSKCAGSLDYGALTIIFWDGMCHY
jgi:SulP family sulfate permease